MLTFRPKKNRFEWEESNEISFINYRERNNKLYLTHSEVPLKLRGKGVGKILVENVFQYLIDHKVEAIATCSFIRKIAKKNPKWKSFL